MRLSRLTILLLLAVIITVEPVVHTHPLVPDRASRTADRTGSDVCAICATGADSITLSAPVIVAPVVVSCRFVEEIVPVFSAVGSRPRASRAPPAA